MLHLLVWLRDAGGPATLLRAEAELLIFFFPGFP